jgi:hypothetical protein
MIFLNKDTNGKLLAIWLLGIVASIGLTTIVSGNSDIAQIKNARSFMILSVKGRTEKFWNVN